MSAGPDANGKLLVVGCGSIGRRHLRNLQALGVGGLIAWDPSASRVAEAVREVPSARGVGTIAEALDGGVVAALICSPSASHGAQAAALATHCHLFVEKPLATTLADALAVRDAVGALGRTCLVACNLRFHPGLVALKRDLVAGAIGRPLSIRAEFGRHLPDWHPWEDYRRGYSARKELGGGVLLDAIHEIDLVRWLCGEFACVRGARGRAGDLEIDTEDLALLIGRTDRGVWCEVHLDYLQRTPTRTCRVIGTEGSLVWDATGGTTTLLRPPAEGGAEVRCDFRGADPNAMYMDQMSHFLRCLSGEDRPEQDAASAAEAVRVAGMFEWW